MLQILGRINHAYPVSTGSSDFGGFVCAYAPSNESLDVIAHAQDHIPKRQPVSTG